MLGLSLLHWIPEVCLTYILPLTPTYRQEQIYTSTQARTNMWMCTYTEIHDDRWWTGPEGNLSTHLCPFKMPCFHRCCSDKIILDFINVIIQGSHFTIIHNNKLFIHRLKYATLRDITMDIYFKKNIHIQFNIIVAGGGAGNYNAKMRVNWRCVT